MWAKSEGFSVGRRNGLATGIAAAALAAAFSTGTWAQQKEVKVALIAPISGPWARQGQLIQMGAEMAVD